MCNLSRNALQYQLKDLDECIINDDMTDLTDLTDIKNMCLYLR